MLINKVICVALTKYLVYLRWYTMRHFPFIFFILFFLHGVSVSQNNLEVYFLNVDSLWARAHFSKANHQYAEALRDINSLIEEKNIKVDSVYLFRAELFFLLEDYKAASTSARQSVKQNPKYHQGYFLLGVIQSRKNNFQGAIRSFTKAISIDATHPKYFYDRAIAFLSEEDLDDALNDLTRAIKLQPNYAHAYYSRGYILDLQGKTNDAIAALVSAIEFDKSFKEPYVELASIYFRMQDKAKACKQIKIAEQNGCILTDEVKNKYCP